METLWKLNPDSPWFLFADDDTYLFRPAFERRLPQFNSSGSFVLGRFWTSWQKVTEFLPPFRAEHPFAQGGAGVAVSLGMMRRIGPHLRNCSLSFNDADFAGSMRFAICAEWVIGPEEWWLDAAVVPWLPAMHSMTPDAEIGQGSVLEAPASFHQILPDMFPAMWRAHAIEFGNVTVDLGMLAFTKNRIRLWHESNVFEWRFGYWIAVEDSQWPLIRAVGNWTAKVVGEEELVAFSQEYEGGVVVTCECDDAITTGKVYFSHFADSIGANPVMKVDCSLCTVIGE
jgi:hypothetical protein